MGLRIAQTGSATQPFLVESVSRSDGGAACNLFQLLAKKG